MRSKEERKKEESDNNEYLRTKSRTGKDDMILPVGADPWQTNGIVIQLTPCEVDQSDQMRPNIHRLIVPLKQTESRSDYTPVQHRESPSADVFDLKGAPYA